MGHAVRARQLAFDLSHAESFLREDFVAGPSNRDAFALVARWPDWPAPVVALVGPKGSGKSHLAAIWAAEAGARFLAARALTAANLLAALATGALVVEDLAAGAFDEAALFHLLNLAREHEAFLLLTAAEAADLRAGLPDLASRLRAVPTVRLGAPDDALLRAVLVKLFADRQLQVDPGLIGFLAERIERSVPAAKAAVARLDAEALRLRRPVTRALAAELFREERRLGEPFAPQATLR
jgi:chromosomal replication initiation ATPase DnaA